MLFNSYTFLFFFPIVLLLYYGLSHHWQNRMLLVASYIFYGWWDWRFTILLLLSTVVDFICGSRIDAAQEKRSRRNWLIVSLSVNLGVLAFFKYWNFFSESSTRLLELAGLRADPATLDIVLPVGISFYTFQTVSYTIDIFRGKMVPVRNIVDFALYVSYLPQLVAGPIERAAHLLPAIQRHRVVTRQMLNTGCRLILLGFFKKVAIADSLVPHVDPCFEQPADFSSFALVLAVYLFAIQIYCDFSGYTDIARGISRLLGIDLMVNFRQPYFSTNITEFWRRWHISLSSWLRDYLYIPLGGNRCSTFITYRNIMITMLLGGLWHGASWAFVIWGGLHGIYLAIHKSWTRYRESQNRTSELPGISRLHFVLKAAVTWHLVCFAWIFFRAGSLSHSLEYIHGILFSDVSGLWTERLILFLFYGGLIALIDFSCFRFDSEFPAVDRWPAWVRGTLYAIMFCIVSFLGESNAAPFIYFQF